MSDQNAHARIASVKEKVVRGHRFWEVKIQAADDRAAFYRINRTQLDELKTLVSVDCVSDLIGARITIPEKELHHAA